MPPTQLHHINFAACLVSISEICKTKSCTYRNNNGRQKSPFTLLRIQDPVWKLKPKFARLFLTSYLNSMYSFCILIGLMPTTSSRSLSTSILSNGFCSEQSRPRDRSCAGLSTPPFATDVAVQNSKDNVLTLANAALLVSSLATQTEHASMPCSAQVSNELATTAHISGPAIYSDDHTYISFNK